MIGRNLLPMSLIGRRLKTSLFIGQTPPNLCCDWTTDREPAPETDLSAAYFCDNFQRVRGGTGCDRCPALSGDVGWVAVVSWEGAVVCLGWL